MTDGKFVEPQLAPNWNPELAGQLTELLHSGDLDAERFQRSLVGLQSEHGAEVYSELLYLLCHLRFEPDEASRHWRAIAEHRQFLIASLGTSVDLRVAMVSYFLDSHPVLESPTVIELRMLESARNFAFRDPLTGLYNYRFFRDFLPRELSRSDQYNAPLSLVFVDIDDFKVYNDRHGHEAGNVALARVAELLEGTMRKVDVAVRFGGEEFVVVLPSTPKTGASLVADRTRIAVEQGMAAHGDSLTVSIGVATYPADADNERDLLRHADRAMYVAKSSGKNQVELYSNDRRSYDRVRASLDGAFRPMESSTHPLETVDVSRSGLRFRSDRSMAPGSLVDIDLIVAGADEPIQLAGRVVESEETGEGRFEVAVRIVEIDARDRQELARYLRELSGPMA